MHTIYVAGPVLRTDPLQIHTSEHERLYDKLSNAARRAKVAVRLPIHEPALDALPPDQFVLEIRRRIEAADSLLALITAPGGARKPRISVAGEAHWAARAGKTVVLLGSGEFILPPRVPGLYYFKVESSDVLDLTPVFSILTAKR
jgi:hypothetical protein